MTRDHGTCCPALALAFFAQLNSDPDALAMAHKAAEQCEHDTRCKINIDTMAATWHCLDMPQ